jgi:hypothetical protein
MGRGSDVKMKKGYLALLLIGLVAGGCLITAYWDDISGWITGLSQEIDDDVPVSNGTDFLFAANNYATGEDLEDARFSVYRMSIVALTDEQIEDRRNDFSYYELAETVASRYTPNYDEFIYMVNGSLTGFDEVWFMPELGLNTKSLLNSSESNSFAAISKNALNSTFSYVDYENDPENGTIYTNDREWTMYIQTLDTDGDATALEGIRSTYDFETDVRDYIVLRITTNETTAESKWVTSVDDSNVATKIAASGAYVYLCFNSVVLGQWSTDIKFSTALGVDFEPVTYTWGTGSESDFTAL